MSIKKNKNSDRSKKYIVTRNGFKVSELEYNSSDDAKVEFDFWNRVITNWHDDSKLEIIEK